MPPRENFEVSNLEAWNRSALKEELYATYQKVFQRLGLQPGDEDLFCHAASDWFVRLRLGNVPSQEAELAAWAHITTLREEGHSSDAIDCLTVTIVANLANLIDYDREAFWWASIKDANFMAWELFDSIGVRFGEDMSKLEYVEHPLVQRVLDFVRQNATPEYTASTLRAFRLWRLTQGVFFEKGQELDYLPEDRELADMGLLQDELTDWREHASSIYPAAPWEVLEEFTRNEALWGEEISRVQRLQVVTNFGGSFNILMSTHAPRRDIEHLKAKLSECERWQPGLAIWDELRMIYAVGLYTAGYPDRARLVVGDMRTPRIMLNVVNGLLEQGQHDEAWKLVRVLPHTYPITQALISDFWPDAPLKRKKLEDILAPINPKNMNRYPPWLREGCREDMIAIYEEKGDQQAAASMRESLELLRRQKGNYFNYRGNGTWR